MAEIGKELKSYRKADLENQRSIAYANKKIVFAHQSPGSETTINLGALTLPTSMSANGFTNPSAATLLQAHILLYRKNLTLHSSVQGPLFDYKHYTVTGPQTIALTTATVANEIIYGVLDSVPQSPNLFVDATPITVTGTLTAGTTDIVVGTSFLANAYSPAQIGQVMLILDGKIQFRNALNATASSTADGNYQEVGTSGTLTNLLRVNQAAGYDRAYMVIATNGFVERPDGSMQGQIEAVAGAVNAMKSYVAALAGVDPSVFGVTPSTVDLTAFGNNVLTLISQMSSVQTQLNALSTNVIYSTASGQSIPNSSSTIINFDTLEYDSLGLVTTGAGWVFKAKVACKVHLTVALKFTANANGFYEVQVFKNGAFHRSIGNNLNSASMNKVFNGGCTVKLNAGETVSIAAFQNTGGALALTGGSDSNYVMIEQVGF